MILSTFKSRFFKNVATLSSGIVIAHAITILASLILTRIYSPEQIGFLTFLNSVAIVLANVFTLGYEFAIVTPKNNGISTRLTLGAFGLLLIFSLLLTAVVILYLFADIEYQLGIPTDWLFLLPILVLLLGVINIAQEWFNRLEKYNLLSHTKVLQSFFTAVPQILLGFSTKSLGLAIGLLIGRAVSAFVYIWKFTKNFSRTSFTVSSIFQTLKNFNRYPKYISPTIIVDRLSLEAPYFLISLLFTDSALGFFAISYRVLSVPLSFIGTAVGQVFFKLLSTKKHTSQKMTPTLIKTWLALALLGIIPMSIIWVGGPELFQFVFGKEWGYSGTIAILLVPMLYLDFISSPTGRSFLVLKLEHLSPVFSVARIIYVVSSFLIGYYYDNLILAILLLSLSRAFALVIQNVILLIKTKDYDKTTTDLDKVY